MLWLEGTREQTAGKPLNIWTDFKACISKRLKLNFCLPNKGHFSDSIFFFFFSCRSFICFSSPAWLLLNTHHLLFIVIQSRFRFSSSHNLIYFRLRSFLFMLKVEIEHNPGIINDAFIMSFCFSTGLLVGFFT